MGELINLIIIPLTYGFMVRGLLAVSMVSLVSAIVGTFVVLRGMAFLGDALAHAILPGIVIGFLIGGGAQEPLFWWGLITAVITALAIGRVSQGGRLKEDTAIGIIFAGMFALGIALMSTTRSYAVDLTHFLFGNVLGVSTSYLVLATFFAALIILAILAFYKELLVLSFDPVFAATLRLPINFLNYLLLILIAVSSVISLQTVGVTLMVAMLITPPATAYLLTQRLPIMMVLAAVIGVMSGLIGIYLSFYFGLPSGAAIVLVCTAFFGLIFIFSGFHRPAP